MLTQNQIIEADLNAVTSFAEKDFLMFTSPEGQAFGIAIGKGSLGKLSESIAEGQKLPNIVELALKVHRGELSELQAVELFRACRKQSDYLRKNSIRSARTKDERETNFLSALRNQAALLQL